MDGLGAGHKFGNDAGYRVPIPSDASTLLQAVSASSILQDLEGARFMALIEKMLLIEQGGLYPEGSFKNLFVS